MVPTSLRGCRGFLPGGVTSKWQKAVVPTSLRGYRGFLPRGKWHRSKWCKGQAVQGTSSARDKQCKEQAVQGTSSARNKQCNGQVVLGKKVIGKVAGTKGKWASGRHKRQLGKAKGKWMASSKWLGNRVSSKCKRHMGNLQASK